ncbi:hypothetical protein [Clostridium sp.]|uniref:hypothetical protein n=1 Tax=Clostridium sp. TaxID=1506 RepID=UPI0032164D43
MLIVAVLIIILPILIINIDTFRNLALSIFKSKENASQYLQFIGAFLGVTITIIETVLIHLRSEYIKEKKEKENNLKELIKIKEYLCFQLKDGLEKFNRANQSNKDKDSGLMYHLPRNLYIDKEWMSKIFTLYDFMDKDLFNDICKAFQLLISMNNTIYERDQYNKDIKGNIDFSKDENYQEEVHTQSKAIKAHINAVAQLYDIRIYIRFIY